MKLQFIKSAAGTGDYPIADRPEVAIVGRSNAGKSSFLNALAGKKVAKVSQTPGKTRLLNFFNAGEHYRWVDMPGYGFAARGHRELIYWQNLVEEYLLGREVLRGLVLVMDVRRDWQKEEAQLVDWWTQRNLPFAVLLNKSDKLSRSQMLNKKNALAGRLKNTSVFAISALKRQDVQGVEEFVFRNWIQTEEQNI